MRSWIGLLAMGSVGLWGCTGNGAGEGAGPALVMLDEEARGAGFALVTSEGKVTPVTPVELEGDVTLVGPGQRIPLTGAPGELLVVTGKRGVLVPHTLSTEVDADAVRVTGAEAPVRALATALGAHVSTAGEGRWELRAPGLVASLAHQPAPAGVSGIEAVDVQVAAVEQLAVPSERPFSASDPRFASFASLGARAPACSDPAVGTWVSTPNMFQHWHVFTLHVQPGARAGELGGTVTAHVWSGEADEAAPAACADHELDVNVSMPATGTRAPDGSFRFDAGRWQVEGSSCTGPGEGWDYLPDHFSGVAEGGALRTVNRDGSAFNNAPVGFERISCE